MAFLNCHRLCALAFEEGSLLTHVGELAFNGTHLAPEQRRYPNGVVQDKSWFDKD